LITLRFLALTYVGLENNPFQRFSTIRKPSSRRLFPIDKPEGNGVSTRCSNCVWRCLIHPLCIRRTCKNKTPIKDRLLKRVHSFDLFVSETVGWSQGNITCLACTDKETRIIEDQKKLHRDIERADTLQPPYIIIVWIGEKKNRTYWCFSSV